MLTFLGRDRSYDTFIPGSLEHFTSGRFGILWVYIYTPLQTKLYKSPRHLDPPEGLQTQTSTAASGCEFADSFLNFFLEGFGVPSKQVKYIHSRNLVGKTQRNARYKRCKQQGSESSGIVQTNLQASDRHLQLSPTSHLEYPHKCSTTAFSRYTLLFCTVTISRGVGSHLF